MAILASELRYYGANTMQDTDSGTQGGAINTAIKIEFTQMTGNSTLEAVSSAGGDTTQTVTVTGRNAAGELITHRFCRNIKWHYRSIYGCYHL